jgi:hypothetical protein
MQKTEEIGNQDKRELELLTKYRYLLSEQIGPILVICGYLTDAYTFARVNDFIYVDSWNIMDIPDDIVNGYNDIVFSKDFETAEFYASTYNINFSVIIVIMDVGASRQFGFVNFFSERIDNEVPVWARGKEMILNIEDAYEELIVKSLNELKFKRINNLIEVISIMKKKTGLTIHEVTKFKEALDELVELREIGTAEYFLGDYERITIEDEVELRPVPRESYHLSELQKFVIGTYGIPKHYNIETYFGFSLGYKNILPIPKSAGPTQYCPWEVRYEYSFAPQENMQIIDLDPKHKEKNKFFYVTNTLAGFTIVGNVICPLLKWFKFLCYAKKNLFCNMITYTGWRFNFEMFVVTEENCGYYLFNFLFSGDPLHCRKVIKRLFALKKEEEFTYRPIYSTVCRNYISVLSLNILGEWYLRIEGLNSKFICNDKDIYCCELNCDLRDSNSTYPLTSGDALKPTELNRPYPYTQILDYEIEEDSSESDVVDFSSGDDSDNDGSDNSDSDYDSDDSGSFFNDGEGFYNYNDAIEDISYDDNFVDEGQFDYLSRYEYDGDDVMTDPDSDREETDELDYPFSNVD